MGVPSDRRMMKSSMSSPRKRVGPCTASFQDTTPSGTRKRSVKGSPAAARRSDSAGSTARQVRS